MTGRTTWWGKDAAWHRRELIVELGEQFGPAGPMIIDVLSAMSQEQHAVGMLVRGGFRVLAREAFVDMDTARAIVERAAAIGQLDDLEVDEDGRRFHCRVSGLEADQKRARAAYRKAAQREREADASGVTERDMSQPAGAECDESRDRPVGHVNQTTPDHKETTSVEHPLDDEQPEPPVDPEALRLSRLLAALVLERDPKASVKPDGKRWLDATRLLLRDRGGDVEEVERILRWSQTDPFWQTNILSPTKLRAQFSQLLQKSRAVPARVNGHNPERDERRARGVAAIEALQTQASEAS